MSLFDSLNGKQQRQKDPAQLLQDLKQNPVECLQKDGGYNIPGGMTDPEQLTQYLLSSGQASHNKYTMIMQMLGGRR